MMIEAVSVSGREMYVECPECGKPDVRFNETSEIVKCPVHDGQSSGCGAEFRISAAAQLVEDEVDDLDDLTRSGAAVGETNEDDNITSALLTVIFVLTLLVDWDRVFGWIGLVTTAAILIFIIYF